MIRSSFAAIALLAFTAPNVDAVDRQAVTTVKPLLVTAIEQGEAHGVLVGQAAQYIAQTFKSTAPTAVDRSAARVAHSDWRDRERGWCWYDDPLPERNESPKPKPKAFPTIGVPATPKKPNELVEFEALQKRVEDLRNIAIINPSE